MYTHAKHGYLGKGNRTPLPSCVLNYIRSNFPDRKGKDNSVGFIGKENRMLKRAYCLLPSPACEIENNTHHCG
jgi:hypothetical protein